MKKFRPNFKQIVGFVVLLQVLLVVGAMGQAYALYLRFEEIEHLLTFALLAVFSVLAASDVVFYHVTYNGLERLRALGEQQNAENEQCLINRDGILIDKDSIGSIIVKIVFGLTPILFVIAAWILFCNFKDSGIFLILLFLAVISRIVISCIIFSTRLTKGVTYLEKILSNQREEATGHAETGKKESSKTDEM